MSELYDIVRLYFNDEHDPEIIKKGVTLEEAKRHCSHPDTSSTTCTTDEGIKRTEDKGPWFDGYRVHEGVIV